MTIPTYFCVSAHPVFSAPTISKVSGNLSHGQSISISGSNFGIKTSAAPVVWDDCSGSSITNLWDGAYPNSGTSAYRMQYQTPIRGIPLPHSHITKYMTGAHGDSGGYNAGYNVMVYKTISGITYPKYIYWSAYTRLDPKWSFGGDDNLKTFDFSNQAKPYIMNGSSDSNWYAEYNGRWTSTSSGGAWHLNDDGGTLQNPDAKGKSWWWSSSENPFTGWIKTEYEVKISNQNGGGYIKVWENGVLKLDYTGATDKYSGNTKTIALGGYARMYGKPNNYRYFADLYLDYSRARIILGNKNTLNSSTVREVQIPTGWTTNSITARVNQGTFNNGATAYLFVVDPDGNASSGLPVTIGGGTPAANLEAPTILDISIK